MGTFHSVDAESLLFVPASAPSPIAVSLRDISSLEIGRGRPRRTWWGALTGALVFGALGVYAGSQEATGDHPLDEVYPAGIGIAFAIPGAGIGALVGAFIAATNAGSESSHIESTWIPNSRMTHG